MTTIAVIGDLKDFKFWIDHWNGFNKVIQYRGEYTIGDLKLIYINKNDLDSLKGFILDGFVVVSSCSNAILDLAEERTERGRIYRRELEMGH